MTRYDVPAGGLEIMSPGPPAVRRTNPATAMHHHPCVLIRRIRSAGKVYLSKFDSALRRNPSPSPIDQQSSSIKRGVTKIIRNTSTPAVPKHFPIATHYNSFPQVAGTLWINIEKKTTINVPVTSIYVYLPTRRSTVRFDY